MATVNPTLRRRQLAAQLREMRRESGLKIEEVAERLLCSTAKISRMETAQRRVSLRDVRDLCELYGADEAKTNMLMTLAREARQPGLRDEVDIGNPKLQTYPRLEAAASAVSEFQNGFIPGLLQTEDYMRALIRGMLPGISQDVLNARVEVRLERQQRLLRGELPRYWAIFDEAALHRRVGGPKVMFRQLEQLGELSELSHVVIQVIPFDVGAYMALDNSFHLVEMKDTMTSDVVYLEGIVTADYLERPADLQIYREALERLRAAALNPQSSLALIEKIKNTYVI
ncbi:helix-turn-helix transcriptional regulator [Thermopolyspora sp. NPDC052614]|uniref:helix-turn-helix domain-containing protein n=1 Tax=Thermopolyspora sp. NPDC052614 TaxID=3155682 RepID=UPI00342E2723